MSELETYLERAKQELSELLAGEQQYGPEYVNQLIRRALKENKKIVFIPELTNGQNLGLGRYELQPF